MAIKDSVQEKSNLKTKEPGRYAVILHNDDYTTTNFVVFLLRTVFKKTQEEATALTYQIHRSGSGVAGIYTYEIASDKLIESTNLSKKNNQPLRLSMEEV